MGIYIKGFKPQDGLYVIKDGVIRKYKGKGGTVRPYELVEVKEPNEMERVIGVCVKGMKMPKSCMRCEFAYWSNLQQATLCDKSDNEIVSGKEFRTKRASFCPLVEIEAPNGEAKEYREEE